MKLPLLLALLALVGCSGAPSPTFDARVLSDDAGVATPVVVGTTEAPDAGTPSVTPPPAPVVLDSGAATIDPPAVLDAGADASDDAPALDSGAAADAADDAAADAAPPGLPVGCAIDPNNTLAGCGGTLISCSLGVSPGIAGCTGAQVGGDVLWCCTGGGVP